MPTVNICRDYLVDCVGDVVPSRAVRCWRERRQMLLLLLLSFVLCKSFATRGVDRFDDCSGIGCCRLFARINLVNGSI